MKKVTKGQWNGYDTYTLHSRELDVTLLPRLGNNVISIRDHIQQRDVLRSPDESELDFYLQKPYIPEVGARIMSLDDASKKMSKSNPNPGSYISLLDAPADIRKKVSRATTDSGSEVRFDPVNKPEISNLITIYSQCAEISVAEVERLYEGKMYGAFKKELAEVVVGVIEPLQQRYHEIRESGEIFDILAQGAERASEMAEQTLTDVQRMMGFITK